MNAERRENLICRWEQNLTRLLAIQEILTSSKTSAGSVVCIQNQAMIDLAEEKLKRLGRDRRV